MSGRDARRLDDRVGAIEALLVAASDAHHVYERDELGGVYDEVWPEWYASHIVDNGLGDVVDRQVTGDEVGRILTRLWETYRDLDPKPAEPWAAWTAERLAAEL